MANQQKWKVFFLLFVTMFLLGGIQNTKGLILEQVQHDINLDIGQIGTLIVVFQIGFLVASLLTGYLTDKKGLKIMMLTGSVMMAAGLIGTSLAYGILFFFGFYLIIGVGIGSMLVSIVTVIPTFYKEKSGMMFNISNAMFGVGMIVTPLILQQLFSHDISWRIFYVGIAVIVAIIIIVLASLKLDKAQGMEMHLSDFVCLLKHGRLMLVICFIVFYVAAEAAFLNFFPIFYGSLDISGSSTQDKMATAAYVISSFAVLFTVGRFIGGFINMKLGDRKTLILFSLFSLISIVISRQFAESFVYLFMVFGFSMSVLFPTASAVATKLTDKSGSAMGLIYVASGLGGAFAGWLIGQVSQLYGVSVGFNLIIGFVAISFILTLFIREKAGTS
ncbi:MFS transporter [Enterobacteriaceae bacterium H11S18]|uniref:MFS transporter n=1 Tax=Dryocola clanedunensis TaxID=2925396 RepID=UPI0022F00CA5|nr:MFS transporter [Dryocola clanedunensis]MCT4706171.1 MFS transporter [Dryocola clanedunensis]MCT4709109.1 MFS transporter [Dryocola clanedunensis]